MVQIPDSARPYLAAVAKHHFWILAALVPLLLVPAVWSANSLLWRVISTQRSAIDGHVSGLRRIQAEQDHPNARWVEAVDSRTGAVREGISGEWRRFWESQRPLRVWPEKLGDDFLQAIEEVESGRRKELMLRDRQRYQNEVPGIVRGLPARMGCKELMGDQQAAENIPRGMPGRLPSVPGLPGDDLDSPEASLSLDPLVWLADDQRRLFQSFDWQKAPSTVQVRLAQEELWVYGLFCDAIRKLNAGATGAFNASITSVEELAVGYPAAEEAPGGLGGGRIYWKIDPKAVAGPEADAMDGMPPMDGGPGMMPMGAPGLPSSDRLTRPVNPRFTASQGFDDGMPGNVPAVRAEAAFGGGEEPDGENQAAALTADDLLQQWIYVDFAGRPLSSPALRTAADAALTHLVPFTLRVVIDQRKIDPLLRELAAGAVPIDVRQVRINPTGRLGGGGDPLAVGTGLGGEPVGGEDRRRRPHDVTLELRGTVALATEPDQRRLPGGGPGDGGGS